MTRTLLLLAVVYIVVPSPHMSECWNVVRSTSSAMLICDKETAEDMAESLNAAHERRTKQPLEPSYSQNSLYGDGVKVCVERQGDGMKLIPCSQ